MDSKRKIIEQYLKDFLGDKEYRKLKAHASKDDVIIISGPYASGKSTLAVALRMLGYRVVEDFQTYKLKTTKPLEHIEKDFMEHLLNQETC